MCVSVFFCFVGILVDVESFVFVSVSMLLVVGVLLFCFFVLVLFYVLMSKVWIMGVSVVRLGMLVVVRFVEIVLVVSVFWNGFWMMGSVLSCCLSCCVVVCVCVFMGIGGGVVVFVMIFLSESSLIFGVVMFVRKFLSFLLNLVCVLWSFGERFGLFVVCSVRIVLLKILGDLKVKFDILSALIKLCSSINLGLICFFLRDWLVLVL